MKNIFFAVLAVAALASCAKEEAVRVDRGDAIAFSDAFVENSTRAIDPSYSATGEALTGFNVWGAVGTTTPVAIFANDTVTGTVGVDSVWDCTSKTQYWVEGAKYNFAALVNAGTVTLGADLLPATVEFIADGSTDLLYAKSVEYTGQATGSNVPVKFIFEHLLSKVLVKVENNSVVDGYSFTIDNLKINAPKTGGKYYIQAADGKAAKTWEATAGDYTFNDIAVSAATAECDAEQLLIPGSATISFDVITNCGGQPIATKPFSKTVTLDGGKSYSFTIITSLGDPIQFTVEEDPAWTDGGDTTIQ